MYNEIGCELQRKRIESAIMIKVAEETYEEAANVSGLSELKTVKLRFRGGILLKIKN